MLSAFDSSGVPLLKVSRNIEGDEKRVELAANIFDQQGAVWMEGLLDRDFVAEMAARYRNKYSTLSESKLRRRHAMVGDRRFMITLDLKGEFNSPALYANPTILDLLTGFLGDQFLISSFGSVIAFPGAENQSVHCDYPPLFESEQITRSLPPHAVTLVVPLIDINEETGATAMWLGSHRREGARGELERLSSSQSLEGSHSLHPKMGDMFLMDYRLIHAGTANRSSQARSILYIVYSRPWFREDLNFSEQAPIKLSSKQFKKIPKPLRYLFAASKRR